MEETSGTAQEKIGSKKTISFKKTIIAAGSQAVRLPFMPNDPRVVDSTGALELKEVPKRMLILGGGIIGLEMGTVHSAPPPTTPEPEPPERAAAHYLWAVELPLWGDCDAQMDEGAQSDPKSDLAAQPAPDSALDRQVYR